MAFLVQIIKAFYDLGIVCYRLVGLLIVTLATTNNRWLKPLFSQAERQNPSPIQEYDPYVEGLLRYLQSRRRD
jgi:hypothetical protein